MGTIQLFSIRKLKAGAASVALGLFMLSHQVSADEKENGGPAVPEETIHAAEDIVLQDEVIFQGENYNLSDNIVDAGGPAVVDVIDMTDENAVNTDVPGQYTGTVTLVFENNETIQRTVNIIVKESANTDSSNNSADKANSEKPDETAGSGAGNKMSEGKEQPEQEQTEVPKENDTESEEMQNPAGGGEDVTEDNPESSEKDKETDGNQNNDESDETSETEDQEKGGDSESTEEDKETEENQDNNESDEASEAEDQEKDGDSESAEEDKETEENQDNDESDEMSETEDQEKDDDSESTEEDTETGENQNNDKSDEASEDENQEKGGDSESAEEDKETEENQDNNESDEASEDESQGKGSDSESTEEDTDTGIVAEPENSYEETPSEGNDEVPEDSAYPEYEVSDDNGSDTPADTEEIEESPKITAMKSNETADDLDDYMTEDEIAEILGDINLDLEHSNDDESKRKLTRSLLKYLSDLQQGSEYHAVAPPGSRVMTKGEFQKDRDSLYPLNPDKFYNKGDFTADARVEWVAVADYTRDSITPTGNHLYLLDGRNPLSRGHFEVQHYETVNEQNDSISPVFRVSVGTVDSLEDVNIILGPGAGPDGVNWNFDNHAEATMHRGNEFKMSSDIAVGKRFGKAVDISENNIEMNVLEGDQLQVKIKKMNAGEHFMFSVTGTPLNSDGVLKREHFVADARLSADFA
ncbi:YSIRK-type signal peptide-containing protein [Corticicoccus populi]|uniref:YSIRK-type signal peptide-containing protein n=1 Tax=Corticicoccus populi TaxID=1812821 RepID=A0ABW5WWN2_9STAP